MEYDVRPLEIFCVPIIILAISLINIIINLSRRVMNSVLKKDYTFKKRIHIIYSKYLKLKFISKIKSTFKKYKVGSKFLKIELIIGMLTIGYAFFLFKDNNPPYHKYYINDDAIEIAFYLKENAPLESRILKPPVLHWAINRILYNMEMKISINNRNSTYIEIIEEITGRNLDYVIYQLNYYNNRTINDLILSYPYLEELVKFGKYVLFEYIG